MVLVSSLNFFGFFFFLATVMGFTGTWVGRRLIQRFGLLGAGQRALLIQAVFLGVATLAYTISLSAPVVADGASAIVATPVSIGLIVFSCAVVLSRVGMWSFDMVNAQLFQQNVSQREVASASAAEMALCSFSELLMLGLAAYVIGPASFKSLIYISLTAVIAGNVLFTSWGTKKEREMGIQATETDDGSNGEAAIAAAA